MRTALACVLKARNQHWRTLLVDGLEIMKKQHQERVASLMDAAGSLGTVPPPVGPVLSAVRPQVQTQAIAWADASSVISRGGAAAPALRLAPPTRQLGLALSVRR